MKYTKIPSNFIYPDIKPEHYTFGSGKIVGTVLREDGDWRDFLPPEEEQNIRGVESSACYVEAQQHCIATILEETHNIKDQNFSARFNALLSGGTIIGGDPIKGADSIRKDGLVKEESMPWEGIDSWDEFHSWTHVDEKSVRKEGKEFVSNWKMSHDIVSTSGDLGKFDKLRQALKYCPCPISVCAWYQEGEEYVKQKGMRDNHMVEAVYMDDKNRIYVRDTYTPYLKVLAPNYDFDFAMRWTVEQDEIKKNWIQSVINWIKEQLGLIQKEIDEMPKPEVKKSLITPFCLEIQKIEGWYPGSRAYRNNNPGNLKYVGQATAVGKDNAGFAIFPDYATGFEALRKMVFNACTGKSVVYSPEDDLFDFFEKYAPRNDGNDPIQYAKSVARQLNILPATKIKELV